MINVSPAISNWTLFKKMQQINEEELGDDTVDETLDVQNLNPQSPHNQSGIKAFTWNPATPMISRFVHICPDTYLHSYM